MSVYSYSFTATDIDGNPKSLADYQGKTLLVVNVASKCGFTPQYQGLEALYRQYRDRDFVILGFPCNQFGHQEPGDEAEIKGFCAGKYDVSFPLFAKIKVNGDDAHPLYQFLKKAQGGILGLDFIKWNFTKFLIDKTGKVVKRYAPTDTPEAIGRDLAALL